VNLPPESYFEDESAQPISLMQIFDEEAKREHGEKAAAILLGHPESIVRHVPAEPVRAELWSQMDADLVDHLFDVYTELVQSRWLQARCVVASGARGEYRAILPVPEDCMAVILPFRQLYSRDSADDLFNRCCKIHNRHCPSKHVTYWWVAEYQSRFNTLLEEPVTFPLSCPNLPARRYLDAFAYGAKIVHASSRSTDPAAERAGRDGIPLHPENTLESCVHGLGRTRTQCEPLDLRPWLAGRRKTRKKTRFRCRYLIEDCAPAAPSR